MKILDSSLKSENSPKLDPSSYVVFEVPAKKRVIQILKDKFYLSLPSMRFLYIPPCPSYVDTGVVAVAFLDDCGQVYPCVLPNVYRGGFVCMGKWESPFIFMDSLHEVESISSVVFQQFVGSAFTEGGQLIHWYLAHKKFGSFSAFFRAWARNQTDLLKDQDFLDWSVKMKSDLELNHGLCGIHRKVYETYILGLGNRSVRRKLKQSVNEGSW